MNTLSRVQCKDVLLDQYYTKKEVIKFCVNKIKRTINLTGMTLIDTSCGNNYFGATLDIPHYSFDICLPEIIFQTDKTRRITTCDFLSDDTILPKVSGKTIMGFNPPYGLRNELTKKFLLKMYNWSPDYIVVVLLKSSTSKWEIPNYSRLLAIDLPVNSFEINKKIPTEFLIFRKRIVTINDFLPRAKIQKYDNSYASIKRSENIKPGECSIAVRYCGANAGAHYYIFHHNNIYFWDYNKFLISRLDKPKHSIPNVFTVINFKQNMSLGDLERIVKLIKRESKWYINKNAIRYNFNTGSVIKIFKKIIQESNKILV